MTERKSNSLFTTSRIVFFVLSLVVFYFAIHYLGKLEDIKNLLLKMKPFWLFIALGFQLVTYFISALIVHVLLQNNKNVVNFFKLFKIAIVILFVNQVLPSGGISGNSYIFNQLVKRNVPSSKAFTVLILESIGYYIATLLLLILFYSLYYSHTDHIKPIITYTTITGLVFFAFLGIVMSIISDERIISYILKKLYRFSRIRHYIMKANLSSLPDGHKNIVKMFLENMKGALLTIAFQICIITFDMLTAFAIIKGFQIELPFMHIGLAVLLSLIIGALPISPGSLIVYESAMTFFLTILGLPIHAALIVTLIFRFFTFWLPIPFGLLFYRNLQKI
jgi:uncharacterized protein (TIRG00374 family)